MKTPSDSDLKKILVRIDGRGYKAYKDIKGSYRFPDFTLSIDHVQGDPFASPSRFRVIVPQSIAGFDPALFANKSREVALRDFLTRTFYLNIRTVVKGNRGIGTSGVVEIDNPAQEILERTSVFVDQEKVEARFVVGLPARGRTILAREAEEIIFKEIPELVRKSLLHKSVDAERMNRHIDASEDQDVLRALLNERDLVAFLADDSSLPRQSGIDDRPLASRELGWEGPSKDRWEGPSKAIPFKSPEGLEIGFDLPHQGRICGLGIPKGVTLIVGGGFHGKSTLLRAIERGVYNHIPGDGREYVSSISQTVKIKAEDGRRIERVNISPFIQNLPFGKDTFSFCTDNASGSTSQAANIIEALEMGARLLLIDEDTSATNFMIRDERMQELVSKESEPITPFVDKVRQLYTETGVSTILVMGGSGDYFDVADRVLMMDQYRPRDVLPAVKEILCQHATRRKKEGGDSFGTITKRSPLAESFKPQRGKKEVKILPKGLRHILFGRTDIDLSHVEQLVDISQTRAIGYLIHHYSQNYAEVPLAEGIGRLMEEIEREGLDHIGPHRAGDLVKPRIFEIAAAINRMRSLRVRPSS